VHGKLLTHWRAFGKVPPDRKKMKERRHLNGFTLLELLIVVAIIGLLAALVAPRLVGVLGESQAKSTRAQVELLSTALVSFRVSNGRYPSTEEGLAALLVAPEGLPTWSGPYLRKPTLPTDGWGNPFYYQIPPTLGGIDYDLYSTGSDGQPGGEGEAADIGNWQ
jgi:general secretion pathway protein G